MSRVLWRGAKIDGGLEAIYETKARENTKPNEARGVKPGNQKILRDKFTRKH